MKIVSFNVNGIRAIIKKDFINDFNNLNADIFSLNETKFSEITHDIFPFNPDGYKVYWSNSKIKKGYSGVAIFTRLDPISVNYGLENNKYDDEGRVITLEFETFYYVGAYVPNSGEELKRLPYRLEYESDIINYLNKLNKIKPVIYAGDLNVAHNDIDLKHPDFFDGSAGYTRNERDCLTKLLNSGFVDAFRFINPETVKYSWWNYRLFSRARNDGWRIDYFIVSEKIKDKIINSDILNEINGSDHCPIVLEIDL